MPGGSTFNAIISLARAGVETTFISEAGNDRVGEKIINFLKDNGTDASHVSVFSDSKSPISLAFLDENNDADYVFYKDHPHDQLEFAYPDITPATSSSSARSMPSTPSSGRRWRLSSTMRRLTVPFSTTTLTSGRLTRTRL